MTAVCNGGTSAPQPGNANVVVFTATALASYLSNKGMGWAYGVAPMLGTLTFDLPSFCAGDPPALPNISASDVLGWFNPLNPQGAAQLRNVMGDLVGHFLWWDLCECTSGTLQPPPTPVKDPTGGGINPGSGYAGSAQPCWDKTATFPIDAPSPINTSIFPPQSGTAGYSWGSSTPPTIKLIATANSDGTTPGFFQFNANFFNSSNQVTHSYGCVSSEPGSPGFVNTLQGSGSDVGVTITSPAGTVNGQNNTCTIECQIFNCPGSTSGTIASPCCPPDPVVAGTLSQILNLLNELLAGMTTPLHSYASGTVHTGLSGSGTITLTAASPLAIRVDVTGGLTPLGTSPGDPAPYYRLGWIVPIINMGPIRTETQLLYNPQVYVLPVLTEQIGYSLHSGVTVNITELVAGP